ncbi:MAG: phosphatase PAP2 family protein [Cyanobacteria bacterium CRU_2_1]|nr:phosphatase PAP2 family protein [Cyanobacteria bacterium RU_5_0]NJR62191.1 phosphatase PAP2 family protein [Cyanobacteria bacterium CRU_2_1]
MSESSNLLKPFQSFGEFTKQWFGRNWQVLLFVLLGLYAPLMVFGFLALQIWKHESGLTWDVSIMMAIHASAQIKLDILAARLTDFGTKLGVLPMTIILSLVLLYLRRWRSLTYFLITMIGCGLINHTAKAFLHRVRPSLWDYPRLTSFSFPSGHAMSSMVLVAALIILTWGTRWCWVVLMFGSVFVVAIGWTRLYLGVHYPSDILAGWMMSIAWAVAVSLIVRPRLTQPVEVDENPVVQG